MAHIDPDTGTVFLNSATVPRVTPAPPLPTGPHDHDSNLHPDHHHHKRPHGTTGGGSAGSSPPTSPKAYGSGRRARMAAKAAKAAAAAAAAAAAGHISDGGSEHQHQEATAHHFMFVHMEGGEVVSARDVWVQVTPVEDEEEAEEVMAALTAAAEASALAAAAGASTAAAGDGNVDAGSAAGVSASVSSSDGDEAAAAAVAAAAAALPPARPKRVGDFVVHTLRQHEVVRTVAAAEPGKVVKFVWNAYDQLYEPVVLNRQAVGNGAVRNGAEAAVGVPGEDGTDAAAVVVVEAAEGAKEEVRVEAH